MPKKNSNYAINHPEVTTAESFAIMMMYLDKEVFGNSKFNVIDKSLFASSASENTPHIKKEISFDNGNPNNLQCITYTETTITSYIDCPWLKDGQNCSGASSGQCDGCSAWCLSYQTTTTTNTVCSWTSGGGTGSSGFPIFPPSGGGGNGSGNPTPPPCPVVGPITSSFAIPGCPPIPNPWPPIITINPPPVVNDSIIKALLKKDQQDIKAIRDSVWNLAYGADIEYHMFIKNVNGTTQVVGITTDSSADGVSPNKYVRLTGSPDGDYHTHQDHPSPEYRHPHGPEDVSISNGYHKKLFYRSYVDCGDTLYAVVTENLAKQKIFFKQ